MYAHLAVSIQSFFMRFSKMRIKTQLLCGVREGEAVSGEARGVVE